MPVIPGIHRPYDDYQFRYARQFHIQVAPTVRRPILQSQADKEGDR
jgi:hypothetical protein